MTARTGSDWFKRHKIGLLLAIILAISLFLRFYDLGGESLWLDEAESIKESALSIQGIVDHTNQPPLYFLLLRGWIDLFGTSEFALRSLSAIFGVLAVLLIYLAGKALASQRTGLIGAFLGSFAYFPLAYSQEARAYSLLLLLSLLSSWFFIEIIKKDRKWLYPVWLAAGILLAYTHFYGLFIIAAQTLFMLIFLRKLPSQRWKFFITMAALGFALIPLALLLKERIFSIAGQGFWIPEPAISDLVNTLTNFCATGPARYWVLSAMIILAIAGLFLSKRKTGAKLPQAKTRRQPVDSGLAIGLPPLETYLLLVLWLAVPILIPFIESQFMTPIYQSRYAIGAYPALCLLAANGLANIRWQWLFYPVLALIVALSSIGLYSYYKSDVKEPWRQVSQIIVSKGQPQDVVVLCEGYYASAFNYYYKGNLREAGISNMDEAKTFTAVETDNLTGSQSSVWLVLAYNKQTVLDYFIRTWGKESVKTVERLNVLTVVQFQVAGSNRK